MGGVFARTSNVAILFVLGAALFGAPSTAAVAQAQTTDHKVVYTRSAGRSFPAGASQLLFAQAVRDGSVDVIAGLDMSLRPEDTLPAFEQQRQGQQLATLQNAMLMRVLGRTAGADIVKYTFIPFVALSVNQAQLSRLLNDVSVITVEEDGIRFPSDTGYNVTLTETDKVWDKKFDGAGYAVAILDSGVDPTHPMLQDKLVSEACYSSNHGTLHSMCPDGAESSTAPGSGNNCPSSIDLCYHGTAVASIAVGDSRITKGIAPGSFLISIKITSKKVSGCLHTSPCVVGRDRDTIRGLQRIHDLRHTFNIAAANYSYGGGIYSDSTRCDDKMPTFKAAITTLLQDRIATTIASGNNYSDAGINYPSCISSAIAVAGSDQDDNVADRSNFHPLVQLVAPGEGIKVALLNGQYGNRSGTSLAAPAVAGAFAVLRQVSKTANVDGLKNLLICGGQPVERNGVSKQRFDLLRSYNVLKNPPDREQKFIFSDSTAASYWTPFLGTWTAKGSGYVLTKPNESYYKNGIWFPSCVGDATVTAVMTRVNGDESTAWGTGIIVDGLFDQKRKLTWGYRLTYNIVVNSDPPNQDLVQIWRLDGFNMSDGSGSQSKLCEQWVTGVSHGKNTVKVVSQGGVLQLYVNGQLDCSANDTTYTFGNVMVEADLPAPPNGTKQSFTLSSVKIDPILPPEAGAPRPSRLGSLAVD
jgi:subtilisin family serine protease